MLIDGLFLAKAAVSILIVVALSLIAERAGPRIAGLLTGLPLGAGMVLIFTGIEQGTLFAAEAAKHMVPGFVTTATFVYIYAIVAAKQNIGGLKAIVAPMLFANLGYGVAAWLVSLFSFGFVVSVPILICVLVGASRLMLPLPNTPIIARVRFGGRVLAFRAGMATLAILIITGLADNVGPQWTGILTAYPMTLLPLILVLHITYSGSEVSALLKHVPMGLGGVISFCIASTYALPVLGLGWGATLAYSVAFAYLLGYSRFSSMWARRRAT